jgi:hypothetical protein
MKEAPMQTNTFALTIESRLTSTGALLVQARGRNGALVWLRFAGDALVDARTSLLRHWAETKNWIVANAADRLDDEVLFVLTNVRMETTPCEDGSLDVHSWSFSTLQGWQHRPVPARAKEALAA